MTDMAIVQQFVVSTKLKCTRTKCERGFLITAPIHFQNSKGHCLKQKEEKKKIVFYMKKRKKEKKIKGRPILSIRRSITLS